jgi:hypothetical protein
MIGGNEHLPSRHLDPRRKCRTAFTHAHNQTIKIVLESTLAKKKYGAFSSE